MASYDGGNDIWSLLVTPNNSNNLLLPMLLFAALFQRAEQIILERMPSLLQNNHVNALNKIKGMPVRALLVRAEELILTHHQTPRS